MGNDNKVIGSLLEYVFSALHENEVPNYYLFVAEMQYAIAPRLLATDRRIQEEMWKDCVAMCSLARTCKGRDIDAIKKSLTDADFLKNAQFNNAKELGTVVGYFQRTLYTDPQRFLYESGVEFLELEDNIATGRLKNDARLHEYIMCKTRNALVSEAHTCGTLGFGDSEQDTPFLSDADIQVAVVNSTDKNDAFRKHAETNNWIILEKGSDPEKVLFQINWRAAQRAAYRRSIYDSLPILPPAFFDIDNTLYDGFLLQNVVSELAKDNIFPSEAPKELEQILNSPQYTEKGLAALGLYERHKKNAAISSLDLSKKLVECLQKVKFRDYAGFFIERLSKDYQPVLLSAEPLEICGALCEIAPFKNCYVMPVYLQRSENDGNIKYARKTPEINEKIEKIKKDNEAVYNRVLVTISELVDVAQKKLENC